MRKPPVKSSIQYLMKKLETAVTLLDVHGVVVVAVAVDAAVDAAVDLGFTTLLTSQVISVAFYTEREKSDKFCSETLISA